MSFIGSLGAKLGLYRTVQIATASPPANDRPTEIVKRVVTLEELQAKIPEVSAGAFENTRPTKPVTAPPTPGLEPRLLTYDLSKVYTAAKVAEPAHGWSIDRVLRLLKGPELRDLAPEARSASLLSMMAKDGVLGGEVVQDAIARDKALDAFERHLRRKLSDRKKEIQDKIESQRKEVEALQESLKEITGRIDSSVIQMRQDEVDLNHWLGSVKRSQEEEFARAVKLLTSDPVISVGDPGIEGRPPPPEERPNA